MVRVLQFRRAPPLQIEPARIDPIGLVQIGADRLGAPLRKREIVIGTATRVGVSDDAETATSSGSGR